MSTPEPKRATGPLSEPKPPANASTAPARDQDAPSAPPSSRPSKPSVSTNGEAPPRNANGDGPPGSANGSGAQGLSAALAEAPEHRGSKDRSNAIDRQLEDDSRKFKKECKILLLGESRRSFATAREC